MLIFQDKLPTSNRNAIIDKINSVSDYLGISPNWLMAVMNFESNLNPRAVNSITNATGLIQFTRDSRDVNYKTIGGRRYTMDEIKNMGFLGQLELARQYYKPYKEKINKAIDLYLATFFPAAIGKPTSWVLQAPDISASAIASANPIFDPFKTGKVTVGAVQKYFFSKIPADYLKYVSGTAVGVGIVGIGVLVAVGYLIKKAA